MEYPMSHVSQYTHKLLGECVYQEDTSVPYHRKYCGQCNQCNLRTSDNENVGCYTVNPVL